MGRTSHEILSKAVDDGRKKRGVSLVLYRYQVPIRKGIRHMDKTTASETVLTSDSSGREARGVLTEILHHGTQQMLAAAIENEVAEYIDAHVHARDENGQRLVVHNGHMPTRSILTGHAAPESGRQEVTHRPSGRPDGG